MGLARLAYGSTGTPARLGQELNLFLLALDAVALCLFVGLCVDGAV